MVWIINALLFLSGYLIFKLLKSHENLRIQVEQQHIECLKIKNKVHEIEMRLHTRLRTLRESQEE